MPRTCHDFAAAALRHDRESGLASVRQTYRTTGFVRIHGLSVLIVENDEFALGMTAVPSVVVAGADLVGGAMRGAADHQRDAAGPRPWTASVNRSHLHKLAKFAEGRA